MILITNTRQFKAHIADICKRGNEYVYIASFGLKINDSLEKIFKENKKVKIVIGLHHPSSKQLSFFKRYFEKFPNVSYKIKSNSHTKLVLSPRGGLVGGRNLTDSDWSDISIRITKGESIEKLKLYFERLWKN